MELISSDPTPPLPLGASMRRGTAYGERTPERENSRNGRLLRPRETRVRPIELAVLKLCRGVHCPEFLLEPRRRGRTGPGRARGAGWWPARV